MKCDNCGETLPFVVSKHVCKAPNLSTSAGVPGYDNTAKLCGVLYGRKEKPSDHYQPANVAASAVERLVICNMYNVDCSEDCQHRKLHKPVYEPKDCTTAGRCWKKDCAVNCI